MNNSPFNIEEVNKLIKSRRSVYPAQFSEEKIENEIIEQILENANWAPTHKRTEPWRFVVFSGKSLEELGSFQAESYKKNTNPEKYKEMKYHKLLNNHAKASHVIAIVMKRDEKESLPEIEEAMAVACAVQNIYLTATAYGVGGYWSTGGATFHKETIDFLGFSEKDKVLGFFFLGKVAKESPEGFRKPIQDKITWKS